MKHNYCNIDWMSNIPKDWEIERFKDYVEFQEGPGIMAEDFQDHGVPLLRITNIQKDYVSLEGCNYLSEEKVQKKWSHFQLNDKDLLISCSASTGMVSEVTKDSEGSVAYTGIMRLTPKNSHISRFFIKWYLRADIFALQTDIFKTGSTIQHLGPLHLRRMLMPLPLKSEQERISTFLEKQCESIDKVLEVKREQLTVLEELRKSIIHKAVTKGLDDSVEMKDSGIEWVGNVPKHWEKEKLFRICQMVSSGGTPSTFEPDYYDGNIIWVQTGDLNDGYIETTEKTITEEGLQNSSAKLFPAGTLIIALYGATIGKLGLLVKESATNQACCAMVFYPWMEAKYFFYLFYDYRDVLISCSYGGGQNNISQGTIKQTYLCFPKYDEQLEIVKYLDKECDKIENLRKNLNDQISTLQQYRASLIHECVTGKRRITEKDLKELANV